VTDLDAAAQPRWLVPRGLIVVLAVTGLLVSVLAMREFASILGGSWSRSSSPWACNR
jgi:hypothetical protein